MTSNRNVGLIVGVGALGFIAGLALIFANHPIGRAIIIASAIGVAIALTQSRDGLRDENPDAWFGSRRIGFGWGPRNWKGYALVVALIVIILFVGVYFPPVLKT